VIDSTGRVVAVLRGHRTGRMVREAGVLSTSVPLDPVGRSVYSRTGPIIAYLCLAGAALVILWRRPRFPRGATLLLWCVVALGLVAGAAAVLSRGGPEQVPEFVREAEADIATAEGKKHFEHGLDLAALKRLRRAIEVRPSSPEAVRYFAEVCRRNEWHQEGRRSLLAAYQAGARDPVLLEALAYFEYVTDHHEAALVRISQAQALVPRDQSVCLLKAEILWTAGRSEEALEVLEAWLGHDPESRSTARLLAEYGMLSGASEMAEERLRSLLTRDPGDAKAGRLLGRLLIREQRAAEAAAVLERAVAQDPEDPMGLYLLGSARLRLGEVAGAQAVAARILEMVPGHEAYKWIRAPDAADSAG
jgi:Flp pilus assembly protein TadD